MSVSTVFQSLFSTRLIAMAVILLSMVLTGCGAGETSEASLMPSETDVELGDDETSGGDDIVANPEEPEEVLTLELVSQPSNTTILDGQSHTFSLVVDHSRPITVDWTFNGAVFQSSSSTSVSVSVAGNYSCVVTDGELVESCTSFSLSVDEVQFVNITSQPSGLMVNEGVNGALQVQAQGSGTLSYQWYFEGEAISGANSAELSLDNISLADAGEYYCVVSTGGVSSTSNSAQVYVSEVNDGSALISWVHPNKRADDSELKEVDIEFYEIYHTQESGGEMSQIDTISGAELSYVANGLSSGMHYFSLVTVDENGMKSELSSAVAVNIP